MKNSRVHKDPPEVCPTCGEDVPRNALACPECGSDYETGWSDDAQAYHGTDLPDDEFDYDEFVKDEFGGRVKPAGIKPIWWITALVLLLLGAWSYLRSVF